MVPMAKKKTHKKQSFKYAQPTQLADDSIRTQTPTSTVLRNSTQPNSQGTSVVTTNDNPYLSQDLARLGIIGIALVALEFGLWYVFGHTSVGAAVYNLYKIK